MRWCSPVRAVPRPQHCAPLQKPQGPLRVRPKARNKQISTGIWYSSTTAGPHSLLRRVLLHCACQALLLLWCFYNTPLEVISMGHSFW